MLSSSVAHRFAWRMRLSVNKFGDYSLLVLLKKRGKGVATRLKFNMNHGIFEIKELKVNLMALRQFSISDGSSSVLCLRIYQDYIYFMFTFHDFKLRNRF